MRNVVLGSFLSAGLVVLALSWPDSSGQAHARSGDAAQGYELITLNSPLDDHRMQLTVIDPRMRVVSVYHVSRDSGEISLKSVRNIHWDLQMVEFNSVNPLPREIRSLLEQN